MATAGIGVAVAAASAAALTLPGVASVGAATTADYFPTATRQAGSVNATRTTEQVQSVKAQAAWHFQITAAARAQRAATVRRTAAAKKAAAEKAAAAKAAAQAAAQAAALAAQRPAAPASAQAPAAPAAPAGQPSGAPQQIAMSMLSSFGWPSSQFGCLDALWSRESGWSVTASNPDGAYGIPQALPGSKMGSAGPNWQTDAATQIRWGLGYIKGLYGSPCGALSHEQSTGWY